MENKEDLTQYFEDLTIENEVEAQPSKKQAPAKKGFYTNYTHFISIPIRGQEIEQKVFSLNKQILSLIEDEYKPCIKFQPLELFHVSLAMLNLRNDGKKKAASEALLKAEEDIKELLKDQNLVIKLGGLQSFNDKKASAKSIPPKLLYVDVVKESNKELLDKATNIVIRALMEKEVIDADDLAAMNVVYDHTVGMFRPTIYHATLMRIKNTPEKKFDASILIDKIKDNLLGDYNVKRIDISTRFETGEDRFFKALSSINF